MPPNSSGVINCRSDFSINSVNGLLINYRVPNSSMRRSGPSGAGSTTPLATQRSEFEDFMNAYRPNLDTPRPEPSSKPVEDTKVDFGRSIKKLMKRPTNSPSAQNKSTRKEGIQRTPTIAVTSSSRSERERSVTSDVRPMSEKKTKRPLSANLESSLAPPQQTFGPIPAPLLSPNTIAVKPELTPPPSPLPPSPSSKAPKLPPRSPKNGLDDQKVTHESAPVLPTAVPPVVVPVTIPTQVKKKVSIQEEKRRSATDVFTNAYCLIITGNNIGRFLPSRHNPDPILSMRVIPIPERKYHVILDFEESPEPPPPTYSTSGLMVIPPEENPVAHSRDQVQFFSWIRESHVASSGMLLINVEKITEFPFATYLVVNGSRHELAQKVQNISANPLTERRRQLHFIAAYEEAITISKPPPTTFPEKPSSDKTGFVMCLYQVLPGEDGARFEQNWVMWTGARQLYRTVPQYMGLKRISVHKSILPSKIINYCVMCEFSNIMDHLTDACVIIDHLRARCCGFIGIFRVLDSL